MSRLRPGGVVALHISNRYLDLEPIVGRLVGERHLAALTNLDDEIPAADLQSGRAPTQWVVVATAEESLDPLRAMPRWRALQQRPACEAWTDDYSNLLRSIRWR